MFEKIFRNSYELQEQSVTRLSLKQKQIFFSIFEGTATVSEEKGRTPKKVSDDEVDNKGQKGHEDQNHQDDNEVCEDKISNIAGSLSCKNFLRSFAYQYCRHKYIRKNCCASHKIYCRRGRRARQKHRLQQVPSTEVVSTKTY